MVCLLLGMAMEQCLAISPLIGDGSVSGLNLFYLDLGDFS